MDVVSLLNVVLFLPRDLSLVEGAPSDRRRFMDGTLRQVDAEYFLAQQEYDKILPQRNALLKRIGEKRADPIELEYWDEQLGGQTALSHRRAAALSARVGNEGSATQSSS